MVHRLGLRVLPLMGVILCFEFANAQANVGSPAAQPWWWGALIAPLLTGILGVAVAYIAISFDVRKTSNQELIKKRVAIYDDIAPKLNDLICFFRVRGAWKNLPPPLMVQRKRELDRAIYVYGPLFSQATVDQYQRFIHLCFKTFTNVGQDALLRADRNYLQQEWGAAWQKQWDILFVDPHAVAGEGDVQTAYEKLMTQLAGEIGARRRYSTGPSK